MTKLLCSAVVFLACIYACEAVTTCHACDNDQTCLAAQSGAGSGACNDGATSGTPTNIACGTIYDKASGKVTRKCFARSDKVAGCEALGCVDADGKKTCCCDTGDNCNDKVVLTKCLTCVGTKESPCLEAPTTFETCTSACAYIYDKKAGTVERKCIPEADKVATCGTTLNTACEMNGDKENCCCDNGDNCNSKIVTHQKSPGQMLFSKFIPTFGFAFILAVLFS